MLILDSVFKLLKKRLNNKVFSPRSFDVKCIWPVGNSRPLVYIILWCFLRQRAVWSSGHALMMVYLPKPYPALRWNCGFGKVRFTHYLWLITALRYWCRHTRIIFVTFTRPSCVQFEFNDKSLRIRKTIISSIIVIHYIINRFNRWII